MTLQTFGAISSSQIQTEFGGSNPISMFQYYGLDSGIPKAGPIKFSDFYGAILNATRTINSTQNFNARSDFQNNATIVGGKKTTSSVYSNNQAVKYYITVNGIIDSAGTGSYSFDTGTFPAGSSIYLINNNYIVGAGGAGGAANGGGGGAGGPAIILRLTSYITNNGTIAGGGGGGGGGGYGYQKSVYPVGCCDQGVDVASSDGGVGGNGAGSVAGSGASILSGGAGGAGTSSQSGRSTATSGDGGYGGNLGTRGNDGTNGNGTPYGGPGGAAGNYITNGSYATWLVTGVRIGGAA